MELVKLAENINNFLEQKRKEATMSVIKTALYNIKKKNDIVSIFFDSIDIKRMEMEGPPLLNKMQIDINLKDNTYSSFWYSDIYREDILKRKDICFTHTDFINLVIIELYKYFKVELYKMPEYKMI